MYKIYINETPLFLVNTKDLSNNFLPSETCLVARYPGKVKSFLNYVDMMEKSKRFKKVVLHASDADLLWKDFKSLFRKIRAGGGLVFNENKEALLIYRLGYWDLPKGKIEKGEGKRAAAIREVQEETGISTIRIDQKLAKTYHTYKDRKGRRVLKLTHWYLMHTPDLDLTPQGEEGIEEAIWLPLEQFYAENRKTYGNILDVMKAYENQSVIE